MKIIYPPKVERASRSTGPRIATAPNNQDARTGCAGECPLPTDRQRGVDLAHDTTEASHAAEIVPMKPALVVTQYSIKS